MIVSTDRRFGVVGDIGPSRARRAESYYMCRYEKADV
jgi:hypothetical protein